VTSWVDEGGFVCARDGNCYAEAWSSKCKPTVHMISCFERATDGTMLRLESWSTPLGKSSEPSRLASKDEVLGLLGAFVRGCAGNYVAQMS